MNPKIRLFFFSAITALLLLLFFNKCEKPVYIIPDLSNLKSEIAGLKKAASNQVKEVVYKDSIRYRVITKWREVRHDSLIPCEELIAYCDTMYLVDSSLIAEQKVLIGMQDSVIRMQDIVIKSDSVTINRLNKPNRRGLLFAAGFGLGVVVGAAVR